MTDAKIILISAAALLACLTLVAVLKSRRRGGPMVERRDPLPHMQSSLEGESRKVSVALGREILGLLETERRAEAVALVRGRTGWGQAEAERAVEKLDGLRKRLEEL